MSWQINMEPFMAQNFPMFLILMMSGYQQMRLTKNLPERFNLTGYPLLELGILTMMMQCYGQNMIRLMIQLLF